MYLLYSLVYSLGIVLSAAYYLPKARGSAGKVIWRERFGALPFAPEPEGMGSIWVHAVSVGETLAVLRLVRALRERYPSRKVFLSHVTPAGREAGEKRLPDVAGRFYAPLDWAWCVRRVLARIRPALLVVVETELWPNLLHEAQEFGARVVLVNARLSDRSLRGYRLARPFMRRVLAAVDWILAQSAEDAERFRRLGARPERVVVAGNLKFDADPPRLAAATALGKALEGAQRAPVVVAASTMRGEETLLLESWEIIRRRHPRAMLLLAPRHPARFEEVAGLLAGHGRSFVRRTALYVDPTGVQNRLTSPEILLLDTIGELAGMFELADVAFVGGTLVPAGGHNLLEPASWGKPILLGPHMENFHEMAQLFLSAGAALEVHDAKELAARALELLENPERRLQQGEKARQVLEQSRGATDRVLGCLQELLAADASPRAPSGERVRA